MDIRNRIKRNKSFESLNSMGDNSDKPVPIVGTKYFRYFQHKSTTDKEFEKFSNYFYPETPFMEISTEMEKYLTSDVLLMHQKMWVHFLLVTKYGHDFMTRIMYHDRMMALDNQLCQLFVHDKHVFKEIVICVIKQRFDMYMARKLPLFTKHEGHVLFIFPMSMSQYALYISSEIADDIKRYVEWTVKDKQSILCLAKNTYNYELGKSHTFNTLILWQRDRSAEHKDSTLIQMHDDMPELTDEPMELSNECDDDDYTIVCETPKEPAIILPSNPNASLQQTTSTRINPNIKHTKNQTYITNYITKNKPNNSNNNNNNMIDYNSHRVYGIFP